jgi:NAD(P)-dependent dehydrogenase (short-subunit alcohol dehydrogenase family)
MPLLAPGDVAEKAAAVEHFMAGCNRRAGRPGRAGQQRGLPVAPPSDRLDTADFDRVLAVNLRGAVLCRTSVSP